MFTDLALGRDLPSVLNDPASNTGGELVIEAGPGAHRSFKLPAGSLLLYPATRIHRVNAVTAGTRLVAFFWVQSMVRDAWQREMLYGLDASIMRITADHPDHPAIVELTAHYHNLIRTWADV